MVVWWETSSHQRLMLEIARSKVKMHLTVQLHGKWPRKPHEWPETLLEHCPVLATCLALTVVIVTLSSHWTKPEAEGASQAGPCTRGCTLNPCCLVRLGPVKPPLSQHSCKGISLTVLCFSFALSPCYFSCSILFWLLLSESN